MSERIVTVGYGFNGDDDHVTNMIYDAMLRRPAIQLVVIGRGAMNESPGIHRLSARFAERVSVRLVAADKIEARNDFQRIIDGR